ncbi:MAG TPA: CsbD family protein [Caulobacteraceae bacterium]|nr:CsbD family protein [Caulobacteraceae bacterium]
MDRDRVEGAGRKTKGGMKEAAGKLTGDEKLKAEGKAQKTGGNVQNAVGGVKDALRGKH